MVWEGVKISYSRNLWDKNCATCATMVGGNLGIFKNSEKISPHGWEFSKVTYSARPWWDWGFGSKDCQHCFYGRIGCLYKVSMALKNGN